MTMVRRFVAVVAFLGLAAYVSTALQGQPGTKTSRPTTPQVSPAKQVSQLAEASESRFDVGGIITYQPVQGDLYFALQVKPKLDPTPQRPRDILIMLSTAATQAGPSWIAGHQIAEGIIESAKEHDRISLWTVNAPENSKNLTKDFMLVKDYGEGKRLRDALTQYRNKEFPSGDTDLKTALTQAIKTFDSSSESSKARQRILLFLGDGLSTHNPLEEKDRFDIAKQMVERKIAFFPVPLGVQVNPNTLHGLANSTGGAVLRTRVDEETLPDALKRYEEAFAGSVLYAPELQLPADMTGVCPAVLPPLRSDSPTLVVGRMKKVPKQIELTISGTMASRKGKITVRSSETVQPPDLDNYFMVSMIDQWSKARDYPAVLRADRALACTFEQTRLQHMEYLESAQLALEDYKIEAAGRLFQQARQLAPHDAQADAGIKIVDRLKDGSLTKDMIRKQLDKRSGKADQLRIVDGKPRWDKADLVLLAQKDAKDELPPEQKPPVDAKKSGIAQEDLLKEHRERQAIEEQKIASAVDDAIRQARGNLATDPDGTLDLLKNLLSRVKDHPDLGGRVRDALTTRLQTALRDSATDVQRLKLKKQDQNVAAAVSERNLTREQERRSFEDRVDAQFRIYKNLMTTARFEEKTRNEILQAMVQIQDEARMKGLRVPMATKAMYDIALAAYPLQKHNSLIRQREEKWLAILMQIEKSHIPYPDEPPIHFPPLATWKALLKARKDKYEVSSLPDDEEGRKEATAIYRLLQQPIDTKGLQEKVKLKVALEYFADKFGGKLPILVDKEAFSAELGADAPDPYEEEVVLPPVPTKMVMNTALRLILSQVGKGNATYVIRRSFVEITTVKRYLEDKVIRIYPVGDLVMPINGGVQGGAMGLQIGGFGGGFGGQFPGGFGGQFPGGFGGQFPGGFGGQFPGGFGGQFPGGFGGQFPGGFGGQFPGGFGGQFPGGFGGQFPGGFGGQFQGGFGGGFQFPGGFGGQFQGGFGGQFQGGFGGANRGTFQGAFNGSLGAVGATQAAGLINIITRIVDPGNWNAPPTTPMGFMMGGFPGFMMGGFPGFMMGGFPGFMMGGFPGFMMGGFPAMMMQGAGPPPDPNVNSDPQTSNSIDFFPPALAIIVRAPARVHTSITGGIVGGKGKRLEAAAFLEVEKKLLAKADNKDPNLKVGAGGVGENDPKLVMQKREVLDPTKVWQEAFDKGGVTVGHVIATADFLFEAGQFRHAAEFLKANLRHGVAVRPWVFEALAVALEASGGDPEEIRRARLSGIALDPTDAQGFLSAARAMADRGQHDRALAFCKQAALLEPTDYHPYEVALAYAENAKDSKAMEWAVGNLVSQDWPVDNLLIQRNAQKRLASLASTLKTEKRGDEADKLEAALQRLNQRDLVVELVWENSGSACELEMKVKEPSGSICTLEQKQTPGGGIMIGYNLVAKTPSSQYVVAQGFSGVYEIVVSRIYGQPLGNRARLIITSNAGSKQEVRRVEIVQLDKNLTFKVKLKDGRRTELASVSPAANQRHEPVRPQRESNPFYDLRASANPNFYGASGPRGGGGTLGGSIPSVSSLAAKDSQNKAPPTTIMQNAVNPAGGGVQMTAQVRMNPDQRNYDMVIRPFFDAAALRSGRPAVNLSVIPGGGN
jgi:hypothetical protein